MLKTFGIRHHGPGSTTSLLQALEEYQPDAILIEGPADAQAQVEFMAHPDLVPPVALLIYNPKNLKQASYYPMASFSPEWQAARFGLQREIPVHFMDLPQGTHFRLNEEEAEDSQIALLKKADPVQKKLIRDPMLALSELAGYTDSERWWEMTFERSFQPTEIFDQILEMIKALRGEVEIYQHPRTLLREAYMREKIRKVQKEGAERIAIVCGAWHAPALQELNQYKASSDKKSLRGKRPIKVKATWITWTYQRLARSSGYGAGVVSPAYYELLFNQRDQLATHWMTRIAQYLRAEDWDASPAHVVEAVRLTNTLAQLRQLPIAGMEEMKEAAISIFCEGYPERFELIEQKFIIGDVVGSLPDAIPRAPLQQDLEKQVKTARLSKEYESSQSTEKTLDLRKATNVKASQLLHQLNILHIPWGEVQAGSRRALSNFKEHWKLQWMPDYAIQVIEAGSWGNTVKEAATALVLDHLSVQESNQFSKLTELLEQSLKGGLDQAYSPLIEQLANLSHVTQGALNLMRALPPVVRAYRYGAMRQLPEKPLQELINTLVTRISIELPSACMSLAEELAQETQQLIIEVNYAIRLLPDPTLQDQWNQALRNLAFRQNRTVQAGISGLATRMLFDQKQLALAETRQLMHYALSKGNLVQEVAQWLEGFLHGSGLLLIHQEALWEILDEWISDLPMIAFEESLPLLRRTFSSFSQSERQKMLSLAQKGQQQMTSDQTEDTWNTERSQTILPTIELLLGK